jgi:hypothetical protein
MKKSNFNYKTLNGFLDINTLSPNQKSYYKLLKPYEINFGNYGTEVVFYDSENSMIYHRDSLFAHQLKTESGQLEFVKWSLDGTLAYFFEYLRDEVYDDVFLDVDQKQCYRIKNKGMDIKNKNWLEKRNELLDSISSRTNLDIIQDVKTLDAIHEKPYLDKIKDRGILQILFKGFKIWHPSSVV